MLMVYLAYSKPNKCGRAEMSSEGISLLRRLLEAVGESSDIELAREASGRPYIIGRKDLDFNVSHSDTLAVCALSVSDGKVGVDAEPMKPTIPPERQQRFANKYFSENEKKLFEASPGAFSRIWTAKESYLKRIGKGIATDLSAVDTLSLPDDIALVTVEREGHYVTLCVGKNVQFKII